MAVDEDEEPDPELGSEGDGNDGRDDVDVRDKSGRELPTDDRAGRAAGA